MSGFDVMRRDNQDVSVLALKGFLDAHTYPHFEAELQKLVDEKRFKIVVDFKELNYISSAGLGVFMGFIEAVRENAGDIKLCTLSPKVFKVFDLLGFPTLYDILPSENDAIERFRTPMGDAGK